MARDCVDLRRREANYRLIGNALRRTSKEELLGPSLQRV